jgi:hypothetical protein
VPKKTEHNDEAISIAQDWLHDDFHRPSHSRRPLVAPG